MLSNKPSTKSIRLRLPLNPSIDGIIRHLAFSCNLFHNLTTRIWKAFHVLTKTHIFKFLFEIIFLCDIFLYICTVRIINTLQIYNISVILPNISLIILYFFSILFEIINYGYRSNYKNHQ